MIRHFTEHPASVGETYLQHMRCAAGFSFSMFAGACACLVHAVLPFMFVRTGSSIITDLHTRMVTHRDRRLVEGEPAEQPEPAERTDRLEMSVG